MTIIRQYWKDNNKNKNLKTKISSMNLKKRNVQQMKTLELLPILVIILLFPLSIISKYVTIGYNALCSGENNNGEYGSIKTSDGGLVRTITEGIILSIRGLSVCYRGQKGNKG
jgi:hypothetical protein